MENPGMLSLWEDDLGALKALLTPSPSTSPSADGVVFWGD